MTELGFDADSSMVCVDDRVDGGEAEATSRGLRRHIGVEDAAKHILGDARTVVCDGDEDARPRGKRLRGKEEDGQIFRHLEATGTDADLAHAIHALAGVLDEVEEDLPDLVGVGVHRGEAFGQVVVDCHIAANDAFREALGVTYELRGIGPFERNLRLAGVGHEFLAHHAATVHGLAHGCEHFEDFRVVVVHEGDLDRVENRCEDVVDVVGDGPGEQ